MKIYNEVVYQIIDDKLVKVSEDSFEYSGEISECSNAGSTINNYTKKAANTVSAAVNTVMEPIGETATSGVKTITEGPGGFVKSMTDTAKQWSQKGSHHLFGTNYDGDSSNDNVDYSSPTYEGGDDSAFAELEAQRRQQNNMRGRGAANQTQGQSATLLTGP